jgi:hypothetical protein
MPRARKKKSTVGGVREGAGRPPIYGEAMTVKAIRAPQELWDLIDAEAREARESRNEAALRLWRKALGLE